MVIFLAGLQGIPISLYEAVELDGGGWWSKLRYITLPLMTPSFFFNAVMGIISSFQIFNEAYIMTDGGPNNASLFPSVLHLSERISLRQDGLRIQSRVGAFCRDPAFDPLHVSGFSRNWVHYETKGR